MRVQNVTHRERFSAVLDGRVPDRIPIVCRLDIWHTAGTSDRSLPPEVAGLSIPEIERKLNMGRSARFRGFHSEVRQGVEETVVQEGDQSIHTLRIGKRSVRKITVTTAEGRRMGFLPHVEKYYLETPDDYRTMIRVWERTELVADQAAFERFDRRTGEDGMPLLVFTLIPFHRIMLEYAGYENFYFHQADFPDLVGELRRIMVAKYVSFWSELARSPARLILHGAHWSSQMTPPPMFEKYFLPYLRRFTDAMHAAGKKCALHADADLTGLLDVVLQTGVDVAECFACAPLVPLTLAETRERLGDRVIIWGGFPSTLLEPSSTEEAFRAYLDQFASRIAAGRAIIVGVSDNVMPDASWERLAALCRRIAEIRPTG